MALTDEAKIVVDLKAQPSFGRNTEVRSQPQSRVGSDGTGAIHDCANAVGRDIQVASQLVDADSQRLHEVFQENLPRMDWIELL